MSSKKSLTLKCENCGHEWNARNTRGRARQCSKCRSRRITVCDTQDYTPENVPLTSKIGSIAVASADSSQIQTPINEPLANPTTEATSPMAFSRLVAQHKTLLRSLYESGLLDDADHEWQVSNCPFCGSGMMQEVDIKPYIWGWRCGKCGKEAC